MRDPVSVMADDDLLYHEAVKPISRFGAFWAAPLAARGAVQAAAPPASCNRL
jgi:hypothetical protein